MGSAGQGEPPLYGEEPPEKPERRRLAAPARGCYDAAMDPSAPLAAAFFLRPAPEVARDLVGVGLFVDGVGGVIVETEAYEPDDPASHSFRGPTARNAAMFAAGGVAYVYRSYGVHWCLNLVTGSDGHGAAVLIRALEPTAGLAVMAARRGMTAAPTGVAARALAGGPGRLCQALGVDRSHDGLSLLAPPFRLEAAAGPVAVVAGPRIGITKGVATPWRFRHAGSPFVSR
jgi:DNA-3-methyladenine glycosylase